MADWQINFGFRSNAQSRTAAVRQIKANSEAFARLIVDEVAIPARERSYRSLRHQLQRSVHKEVQSEIDRMAMVIGNGIMLPDAHTGPYGQMQIRGTAALSDTYRSFFGNDMSFSRQSSGIKWHKRSKRYLDHKQRDPSARYRNKWFGYTGKLKDYLSNLDSSDYEASFGPINVIFTRTRNPAKPKNITTSGSAGGISAQVQVGRLEVLVFNKITPQMLPGLSTFNPRQSNPLPGPGVAQLLPQNDNVAKLMNKSARRKTHKYYRHRDGSRHRRPNSATIQGGVHRPAVDPFVAFYLTRAIPNAVWRRTERLITRTPGFNRAGGVSSSLGSQFEGT